MLLKCCIISILFLPYNIVLSCRINGTNDDTRRQDPDILRMSLAPKRNSSANVERLDGKRYLQSHYVQTCDGYTLTVFRLIYKDASPERFPVLVVHGLFQSSDRFIRILREKSLIYRLQDLGYDVWLINLRGNKYSRHHIYLDPETEKNEFFNYTYEEMAIYDIPRTVDYILDETNHINLHYIGHSIGTTVFFVLNSMKPEYNGKFISAYLMGPISVGDYELAQLLVNNSNAYDDLIKGGALELFPYTDETETFSPEDCFGDITYQEICIKLNLPQKMQLRNDKNNVEVTRGGSTKQLFHIVQNIVYKNFSRWDYGEALNLEKYGKPYPPLYLLDGMFTEIMLFVAYNDEFSDYPDVIRLVKDLEKVTMIMVPRLDYNHDDYIDGPDVMRVIYEPIIKDLNYKWSALQRDGKRPPPNKPVYVVPPNGSCSSPSWVLSVLITLVVVAVCLPNHLFRG